MRIRVKVGFAYHGEKSIFYERSFNKSTLEAFHKGMHCKAGVRMLILIKGSES